MARPTLLIVEPEPNEALSVRKLVLETAKFNVVTAHSSGEGLELLKKFPNVDGIVLLAEMNGCENIVNAAKTLSPSLPVILLSANPNSQCGIVEYYLSSHAPEQLVKLLRSMFGDPRELAS